MSIIDYLTANKEWLFSGILISPLLFSSSRLTNIFLWLIRRFHLKDNYLSGEWSFSYSLCSKCIDPTFGGVRGVGHGTAHIKHIGKRITATLQNNIKRDREKINREYTIFGLLKGDTVICIYEEIEFAKLNGVTIVMKIHHDRRSIVGKLMLVGGQIDDPILVYNIAFYRT